MGVVTKSVITKKGKSSTVPMAQGQEMADQLLYQFNQLHALDYVRTDKDIEALLLEQMRHEVEMIDTKPTYPRDVIKFNPSGASKPVMDLYLKAKGVKEKPTDKFPYHRRWTRNGTAVHGAVQRDLLYSEKQVKKPYFTVEKLENGLPAWEQNILTWKQFTHKGYTFIVNGQMDGILEHAPTGKKVGFEFKTKSTTIGQIGDYRMKDIQEDHKLQAVAYSLLFGIDEYIFMYESLAKDGWTKGAGAKPDCRTFYLQVTDEMRQALLDKFASVCECVEKGVVPENKELGFFSNYKYLFEGEVA